MHAPTSWYNTFAKGLVPEMGALAGMTNPTRKETSAHGLKTGQKVFHNKFGEGVVLSLEGAGDDARAHINFPRHGAKWLALGVAKLTPL